MESDEQKMRGAGHQIVMTLAGSLALVTCKEPLRVSIAHHLRTLLQQHVGEVCWWCCWSRDSDRDTNAALPLPLRLVLLLGLCCIDRSSRSASVLR
jgi:hypothetical protein